MNYQRFKIFSTIKMLLVKIGNVRCDCKLVLVSGLGHVSENSVAFYIALLMLLSRCHGILNPQTITMKGKYQKRCCL